MDNEGRLINLSAVIEKLWQPQIDEYARGSSGMEKHAYAECRPAAAAILLPEEFASIVLTSQMDDHLTRLLTNGLNLDDDVAKALIEEQSFSRKTTLADKFDLITKKMSGALRLAGQVRNVYAHSNDPAEPKNSQKYADPSTKLIELDRALTNESIEKLQKLVDWAKAEDIQASEVTAVKAIMLEMCKRLGLAAFSSIVLRMNRATRTKIVPASLGDEFDLVNDMLFGKQEEDGSPGPSE